MAISSHLGKRLVSVVQGEKCWCSFFYRIRFIAALKVLIMFCNWLTAQNASTEPGVCAVNRQRNHRRCNDRVWDQGIFCFWKLRSSFAEDSDFSSFAVIASGNMIWYCTFWLYGIITGSFFLSFFLCLLSIFPLSSYEIETNVLLRTT